MQKTTSSNKGTQKVAQDLARKILKLKPKNKAIIIALQGDLGSGKTTFVQGFAKALDIKQQITSPTFVILKRYKLQTIYYKFLFHLDCYRIEKAKEIIDLGWKEMINNSENIILIEWPENIKSILSKHHLLIKFKHINQNKRSIKYIDKIL